MVQLKASIPLRDTLLISFPGIGMVGTVAVRYMVEEGGFRWSGYMLSKSFTALSRIKDGKLYYPVNIFSKGKVHAILSDVPLPESVVWDVAHSIIERASKDGTKLLVIVSGVLLPSGEGIYAIAPSPYTKKIAASLGVDTIDNGVITGVSAAILLLAKERNIPALMLLGATTGKHDISSATNVVETLSRLTGIEVDVEKLEERVDELHEGVDNSTMYG